MNELLFALVIIAQVPTMPDQQMAVFTSREQCMQEAHSIIQQGPSAYCVPIAQHPSVEQQTNKNRNS
jgi:hypothetical protein